MYREDRNSYLFFEVIASVIIIACFTVFSFRGACAEGISMKNEEGRLITISQGIDLVLKDSRLIKAALPDNDMALQNSLIARSALLPHLNANISQTFNRYQPIAKFDSLLAPTSNKNYLSYGFDVYQTIFDFGKSLSNFRGSRDLWRASQANVESVRRVATLEFIVAYFDLLEAEKMIEVSEKEVDSISSYLQDIQHLYEQGSVVKNDLLPAKVKLADARQKLITARNEREVIKARLNNILALPLRYNVMVRDMIMNPPQFPDMEKAWQISQSERPEVVFYEDQIKASSQFERAKVVENFPTIYADAGYSYMKNNYVVHQNNASVELGAKMSLFDGGASTAELLKERARQRQLKEQKEKLIEDIKFEIEDSYFGLKNACEKVAVAKDALTQAEENLRFYRTKYNAGSATTTDVLEAITMQTRAQTNYYSDDYELKRSYAKLTYSMGIDLALLYERMESANGPKKQ